jgi:CheY-like chemotaxis protein
VSDAKRVLLVEDNEMNRDMLSRRLARRGFEVGIAVDGRAGVDMALTAKYDVVLMDMNLPEIDGWEAARLIRAGEKGKRVAIIALTAHAMQGDREKALAAGCDEYDTKPIDFERLLAKIAAVLGGTA